MPTDFNNIFFDKILQSLETLINSEFKSIDVYYDEHRGNNSFLITPTSDELISHLNSGIERQYTIEIEYQIKTAGKYNKNDIKQVSNTMERLKRIIFNNMSHSNGDNWFDASIESISYERDLENIGVLKSTAIFNCNNIEII
tara:strand:+ start:459 stop:884 length:426 start_codon:yes stop_codon:yes gene_type:complete